MITDNDRAMGMVICLPIGKCYVALFLSYNQTFKFIIMSKNKQDFITDFLFEVNGQFHQPDYYMLDSFYDLLQKENEEKVNELLSALEQIANATQPFNAFENEVFVSVATDIARKALSFL